MSIREKIYELLEAVESSAEILDTNTTNWDSRKLDREGGKFIPAEVTDPLNLDRNRIDNTLPLEISNGAVATNNNVSDDVVVDGASIVIGIESEEEKPSQEHSHSYLYGESSFANEVAKILQESDIEGIKKFNTDGRVCANMVKRALDKELPELSAQGLQVEQRVFGNRGEMEGFVVTGAGDAKLPKEIAVEVDASNQIVLVLDTASDDKPMYVIDYVEK